MSRIGTISTYEWGEYHVVEWRISHFSTLDKCDSAVYCSPDFSFGGERWYLDIFPNVYGGRDSSGHVDLWLVKRASGRSMRVSFFLSLKTAKGERYGEEHVTQDFDDWPIHYYPFTRFISRTEVSRLRSELVPDDVLTVVCSMKRATSAGREMQLLEAKSQIDQLKLSYNQALQDQNKLKAEAQSKLGVLTDSFKEKEMKLQRHLRAKDDEVNSAKERIMLIEQENASYKSQVARLKQEMEDKERTLRNQIAVQEKKADENRIAACDAKRNMVKMDKEVTELRQRLTLLEREKENLTNAARDEIIRPVPRTCVEACTQTVEERSCVEACTQTVEERWYEPGCAYVEACTQTLEEDFSFTNPTEDYGFLTGINHLLKENTGVDVTFELETPKGKTNIFAHQLILAAMSPYFTDKFYNKERNDGHQIIPLKGVSPEAFEQMIRYCYGENPSLKAIEDACALFKVASEFKVISLQNLCHTFFRHTKIEPGNVFSILKISVEMEDKNLQDMCYQVLQEKTREVMSAYELCDVTPAMVYTLLNLSKLSLNSEYEMTKWIFDWAKLKAEDEDSSSKNAREYLESLLKYMNFLTLTIEEFAILCKDNPGFFSSDEIACICLNLACPGTREMPDWYDKDMQCRVYTGSSE